MKNLYRTFFFILFLPILFNAQTLDWVKQYHKSALTYGNSVCVDKVGNVYVAGMYENDWANHQMPAVGTFLRKYNSEGNLLWSKNYDNIGIAQVALDNNDCPWLTGNYVKNANFGGITYTYTNSGNSGGYYAKFDSSGNILAFKDFNGQAKALNFDAQGNFYITGTFGGTLTLDGINLYNNNWLQTQAVYMFIAKFNSSGACLWAKQSQGWLVISSFYVDNKGTSYIGGHFLGQLTLGSSTITNVGDTNGFVAKYDSAGNCNWVQNIGTAAMSTSGAGQEEINSVSADSSGNVYASGWYDGDLIIRGFYLGNGGNYGGKGFLAKFNKNGICVDVKQPNYVVKIIDNTMFKCGNVSVPGVYDNVNLNAGTYIMKCDTSGKGLWAYQPVTSIGGILNTDKKGNIYLTGSFYGTADFGGTTITGYNDMFVAKISPPKDVSVREIKKNENDLNFSIYPNPTGNIFTLLYSGTKTDIEIKINVIDALGKTVYTETITAFTGSLKKEINLSGISKGTYFIKLSSQEFIETKKIVVE